MEQEPRQDVDAKFEAAVDGLSLGASKALLAILVRRGIEDLGEFEHVVGMTGEALARALDELAKQGLVEAKGEGYDISPSFFDYWEKSTKREA